MPKQPASPTEPKPKREISPAIAALRKEHADKVAALKKTETSTKTLAQITGKLLPKLTANDENILREKLLTSRPSPRGSQ